VLAEAALLAGALVRTDEGADVDAAGTSDVRTAATGLELDADGDWLPVLDAVRWVAAVAASAAVDVVVVVDGVTSDLVVEVVDEAALGAAFTRVAVVRGSDVGEPASVVVTRTSSWGAIR
jgi:hypothetical protein